MAPDLLQGAVGRRWGAAAGARVFTATSSQELLYGFEMLYTIAGWGVPLVLVNVSRGLASPIALEANHNDILSARDSGFLQIHADTCQEVLDTVLMAYRLAEVLQVMLSVLVNLDGFTLSFTRKAEEEDSPGAVSACCASACCLALAGNGEWAASCQDPAPGQRSNPPNHRAATPDC